MICKVNDPLDKKIEAIHNRTPDQKMAREGVPVFIGGEVFEVKPLPRKRARVFREKQALAVAKIEALSKKGDTAENLEELNRVQDDLQIELVPIVLPELEGKEDWIDNNATSEELAEAFIVAREFMDANPLRTLAQTTIRTKTEETEKTEAEMKKND